MNREEICQHQAKTNSSLFFNELYKIVRIYFIHQFELNQY